MPMIPTITSVNARKNNVLEVRFLGLAKTKIVDVNRYIDAGAFKELRDARYFRKVKIVRGGVEWPHKQSLSAETLFADGYYTIHPTISHPSRGPRKDFRRPGAGRAGKGRT